MDVMRLKRFKDKLGLIENRVANISEWKEDFLSDEKSKLACYKAFQEIVEASTDILAMALKEHKVLPKDDYLNIDLAVEKGIIDKKLSGVLIEANGLRNRVVHEYNGGLNSQTAYDSMLSLLPQFEQFILEVEEWLEKH